MDRPFLDHPGPIAFAHRGGASEAPENSMAAFRYAVDIGYRYLETDVHLTADGVLVAFHDESLDRITDRTGLIAQLPWSVVAGARIDGREPIPLMAELLDTFSDCYFNIDPKSDAALGPLLRLVQEADAIDRVCIGSFSDRRLRRAREQLGPGLVTGLGPRAIAKLRAASLGTPVGAVPGQAAQVPARSGRLTLVDARFIAAAHAREIAVHVWTIDDPAEMERLLELGVDGIMTDRPEVLKQVLVARGQWTGS